MIHHSPTPLSCALGFIHHADLGELSAMKNAITASLLADIASVTKHEPTGDALLDEVHGWVDEYRLAQFTGDRLKMLKRIVARQQNAGKPVKGGVTDVMIQRAKEKPIAELYEGRLFKDSTGLCPFHEERTPSFHIFKDNRWKCFGTCNESGDSISFYMKQNGVNFIQAVKALQ